MNKSDPLCRISRINTGRGGSGTEIICINQVTEKAGIFRAARSNAACLPPPTLRQEVA
jgi:hypothetical protein